MAAPAAARPAPAAPPPPSAEIVCQQCQTRNPAEGKFCVSCGSAMTQQAPLARAAEPIEASGAVHLAAKQPPPPVSVTCDRCQGVSDAGMRFCKFCGAPLTAAPPSSADPAVAAVDRYAKTADDLPNAPPARPPQPAAASALNASPALRPGASPAASTGTPPAPDKQGPPRSRTRPDASQSPRDANDEGNDDARVGAKTGSYVPFTGSSSLPAGRLVVVGGDGQEGPSFPLVGDQVDIGRTEGTVVLPDDRYMSPRHARLIRIDGRWHVRDLESTNGVYYRITAPHELADRDLVLLGVEVLRFELVTEAELGLGPAVQHGTLVFGSPALPRPARLVQRTVEGVARDVYHLHRLETVIGRESGDIVFTDDPYMSRRHAMIRRSTSAGSMTLVDLNSSNGTFVAIRGDTALQDGDSIRVGQHLFRVELAPA